MDDSIKNILRKYIPWDNSNSNSTFVFLNAPRVKADVSAGDLIKRCSMIRPRNKLPLRALIGHGTKKSLRFYTAWGHINQFKGWESILEHCQRNNPLLQTVSALLTCILYTCIKYRFIYTQFHSNFKNANWNFNLEYLV